MPPLTGKPEQQRFTVVLTSTSSRRHGEISDPLPERTNLEPAVAGSAQQTHVCPTGTLWFPATLWPSPCNVIWQRLVVL